MPPQGSDALAERLTELVYASLANRRDVAAALLAKIGFHTRALERRTSVPIAAQVQIVRRDGWSCRYCTTRWLARPAASPYSRRGDGADPT